MLLSLGLFVQCAAPGRGGEAPAAGKQVAPGVVSNQDAEGRRVLSVGKLELADRTPQPESPPGDVRPEENRRGFILYKRPASDGVFRHSAPKAGERVKELRITLARGETRHVQFAVYALRDLGTTRAEIAGLRGVGDRGPFPGSVTASPLRLGLWRNYWNPHVTERGKLIGQPGEAAEIAARESRAFWVAASVPEDGDAGSWIGELTLRTASGASASLPLTVEVLPFELAPGMWWGVYYYPRHNRNTARDFADMRAHGVSSMLVCPPGHQDPVLEREGDRVIASFPVADRLMAELKAQGFRGPVAYYPRLLSPRLLQLFDRVDGERFKQATYYGQPCVRFRAEDYPEDMKRVLRDVFGQMVQHAGEANWPEVLWYLVDEPGAAAESMELEWARLELPLFRAACPGERTLCTAYRPATVEELGPYLDVWVVDIWHLAGEDSNARYRELATKAGAEMWGIRWLCQYNTYLFPRYYAGMGPLKLGLDGMTEWTYYGAAGLGDGYDQLRNKEGCHYAYVDADGSLLSTTTWEAVREGINDARYVATLRQFIRRAEASADPGALARAATARKRLKAILADLPWGAGKLVSEAKLDDIRGRVTAEILGLIATGAGSKP